MNRAGVKGTTTTMQCCGGLRSFPNFKMYSWAYRGERNDKLACKCVCSINYKRW